MTRQAQVSLHLGLSFLLTHHGLTEDSRLVWWTSEFGPRTSTEHTAAGRTHEVVGPAHQKVIKYNIPRAAELVPADLEKLTGWPTL